MILSMTGIGRARHQNDQIQAAVDVRAVNNKYLKLNLRLPDSLNGRESVIDKIIRKYLERGTVSIQGQLRWVKQASPYVIDEPTLRQYLEQARHAASKLHIQPPENLADFLSLPGVVADQSASLDDDGKLEWEVFEPALVAALEQFQEFRRTEGAAMAEVLAGHLAEIETIVAQVEQRSPQVVENYRIRVKDRVNEWLSSQGVEIETPDILREVSIFSERCDITEEVIRMQSHLQQFRTFIDEKKSPGRKLDFLCQEMFRETNTIGSKANDVEISHAIVNQKAIVEKMREIVQNIE